MSRFTAHSLYAEQWLFHGPALQAVERVGAIADDGIEGTLRVLPRGPLLADPSGADLLHTDPIILDNFTHLLGCWGLDRLADRGDVIFPLKMAELRLFGDAPEDGTSVACRVAITRLEHHRVLVESEILRPDNSLWMRISGWEDWRFHWPPRYRDVMRRPDVELLGDSLEVADASPSETVLSWLRTPADMNRPVWRDVLEQTQLSPAERRAVATEPETTRAMRLRGLIVAKDAARRLWLDRGSGPIFPADLDVSDDLGDAPDIRPLVDTPGPTPSLAIAHADGVALALATTRPGARPGVALAAISDRDLRRTTGERTLLDLASRDGDRAAWSTRFMVARQAAERAIRSSSVEILGIGPGENVLIAGTAEGPIRVVTGCRDDLIWAWTLGDRA